MRTKKTYEKPVTEMILVEISSIMYETSLPQAGEGETGGEADAKKGWLSEESGWDVENYSPWED